MRGIFRPHGARLDSFSLGAEACPYKCNSSKFKLQDQLKAKFQQPVGVIAKGLCGTFLYIDIASFNYGIVHSSVTSLLLVITYILLCKGPIGGCYFY